MRSARNAKIVATLGPASTEAVTLPHPEIFAMLTARLVRSEGFAGPGDLFVAIAGMPFCSSGTTKLMHIGFA